MREKTKFNPMFERSLYKNMKETDQVLGKTQPPLERSFEGERISLKKIETLKIQDISLKKAILERVSRRKYQDVVLSLDELTYALYMTQGVKESFSSATKRTVPSAGARHAFETYVLVNHVDGLEPGVYRYLALSHALGKIDVQPGFAEHLVKACVGQKMVKEANVTFIWVADVYRMTYRYGERGYRYLLLDAGHVGQNLYLVAEQMQCGSCAIAAYIDEKVVDLLHLDPEEMLPVYISTLGKRKD